MLHCATPPAPPTLPPQPSAPRKLDDCPDDARRREEITNGASFVVCERPTGVRHGPLRLLYPQGGVRLVASYVDGDLDGPWTLFGANGQKEEEGRYVHGSRQDRWTLFDKEGRVRGRHDHLPHDRVVTDFLNKDGSPAGHLEHRACLPDGNWISNDERGKPTGKELYEEGQLVERITIDASGTERSRYRRADGGAALEPQRGPAARADAPRAAPLLLLLVDFSGSMREEASTLRAALAAVASGLEAPWWIAIVAFGGRDLGLFPARPAGDTQPLLQALERFDGGGPTEIDPVLSQAVAEVEARPGGRTHIVLASDGLFSPWCIHPTMKKLRAAGVTASALALGQNAEAALLIQFAFEGGGRFDEARSAQLAGHALLTDYRWARNARPTTRAPAGR